jgi:hypothetical protein
MPVTPSIASAHRKLLIQTSLPNHIGLCCLMIHSKIVSLPFLLSHPALSWHLCYKTADIASYASTTLKFCDIVNTGDTSKAHIRPHTFFLIINSIFRLSSIKLSTMSTTWPTPHSVLTMPVRTHAPSQWLRCPASWSWAWCQNTTMCSWCPGATRWPQCQPHGLSTSMSWWWCLATAKANPQHSATTTRSSRHINNYSNMLSADSWSYTSSSTQHGPHYCSMHLQQQTFIVAVWFRQLPGHRSRELCPPSSDTFQWGKPQSSLHQRLLNR